MSEVSLLPLPTDLILNSAELAPNTTENSLEPDCLAQKVEWASNRTIIYIQDRKSPHSQILKTKTWLTLSFTSSSETHPFSFKPETYALNKPYVIRNNENGIIANIKVNGHTMTVTNPEDKVAYRLKVSPDHNFAELLNAENRQIMHMTKVGNEWKVFTQDEKALSPEIKNALIALVADNYTAPRGWFNRTTSMIAFVALSLIVAFAKSMGAFDP